MYETGRYLTATGNHIEGTPDGVEERSAALAQVYAETTGLEMQLSGISLSYISLALQANYLDRPARCWAVLFDKVGALVVNPLQIFEGRMDQFQIGVGETGVVQVTAESHLIDWERPSGRAWNYIQQLSLWPNDHGIEFMAEVVEKEIWWPALKREENVNL